MSDVFSIEGSYNLVDNVTAQLESVSRKVKESGEEITKSESKFSKFSDNLAKGGKAMADFGKKATLGITVPVVGAGVGAFKLASDMAESINKVDVACGAGADEVKKFSETTLKTFGIAKGTTLDMISTFSDMGTGMGLESENANKMGMSLVGLAGDLASFKNVRVDVAQTALNGIYTGETESLKQLGIVMTEQNLQEYALSQGINKKVNEMTQSEKVQLRYNYVLDKTKNAQGDFAKTSDSASNQIKIFTESLKETGATFGEKILPLITPVIQKVNELMQKFGGLDENTQKTILVLGGIIAIIPPIITALGGLIGGISAISGLFATTTTVVGGTTVATTGLGVAMSTVILPVLAVIAVVGALVGALVWAWQNNEAFRERVTMAWQSIKDFISAICDVIKSVWDEWGGYIMNVVNLVMTTISNIFVTILDVIIGIFNFFTSALKGDWQGCFNALVNIVVDVMNGILYFINDIINVILGIFGTDLASVVASVKNIFNNVYYAITHPIESAKNFFGEQIGKIRNFLNFNWDFPKLKMPHFTWSGSINPLKWGEEGVPKVGVEWYSKGGIFTQPTVLGNIGVGDNSNGMGRNAEAVIPLDRLFKEMREMFKENLGAKESTSNNFNVTVNSPKASASEIARQFKKTQNQLILGF